MHKVELKLSTSLLRYTKEVRADKAFYEAGMVAKKVQIYNHAFIFLNRYLDLSEAIEDTEGGGTAGLSDNTDFEGTDVPSPFDIPLPESNILNPQ